MNRIISNLINYAKYNLELDPRDGEAATNRLLEILGAESYERVEPDCFDGAPDALLEELVSYCVEHGIIEEWEGESLCDKVMGALTMPPSQIDENFKFILEEEGAKCATDWLYGYCVKNSYVKRAKLDKNPRFEVDGLVVTINKSKPEFRDPNKAKAGNSVAGGYPKCVICRENEGYGPRNKRTLRTASLRLGGEDFFWQYSPYGYFNEHGIAVNCRHTPMYVDKSTFYKLMDFVDKFPHYFIGCNAPLPRIGGSVLAHDHFQGGGEELPLHRAKIKTCLKAKKYGGLTVGILDWPGTVVRIIGEDRDEVAALSEDIREAWVRYDNPDLGIIARDDSGVHNAVSPTVIKRGESYEMNIILRSNITSEEYPDGVFHAHPEFHSVKKESIGLIEAQGLFILPGRLEEELARVEKCITAGKLEEELAQFEMIYNEAKNMNCGDVHEAMRRELGSVCRRILENTAVFKDGRDFVQFLKGAGLDE